MIQRIAESRLRVGEKRNLRDKDI